MKIFAARSLAASLAICFCASAALPKDPSALQQEQRSGRGGPCCRGSLAVLEEDHVSLLQTVHGTDNISQAVADHGIANASELKPHGPANASQLKRPRGPANASQLKRPRGGPANASRNAGQATRAVGSANASSARGLDARRDSESWRETADYLSKFSSRSFKEFLVMEKAKRQHPMPWFYSPRVDSAMLGFHSQARPKLRELEEGIAEKEKVRLRRKPPPNASDFSWPMVVAKPDDLDFGRILYRVPFKDDPTWFHLRTIFEKYMAFAPDGNIYANRKKPWGLGAKFLLVPHPYAPGRFCLQTFSGNCISIGSPADVGDGDKRQLNTRGPAELADSPDSSALTVRNGSDAEGEFITLDFKDYAVTAAYSRQAMSEWLADLRQSDQFEVSTFVARLVPAFERKGRSCGFLTGLIIGGFFILFVYNVRFALMSKPSAARARLPDFDVMRFILETLVIHTHLSLPGVLIGTSYYYMTSFRMTAFMLITGIFGANMAYESVTKLLCCTLGTLTLMVILRFWEYWVIYGPEKVAANIGKNFHLDVVAPAFWFLLCLAAYRLLISPLFYIARKRGVWVLVPCVFVKEASYFLMHWTHTWQGWILSQYNWYNFLYFAPYFAVGLLLSPKEWHAWFKMRWVQVVAISYFVLWYLLTFNNAFLQWNSMYCLPNVQKKGCIAHYDSEQFTGPVTIETFLLDQVFFALRLGISLSFMGIVAFVVEVVGRFLPQLIELMAGWGSRTLYAYVIHVHAVTILTEDADMKFTDLKGPAIVTVKWVCSVILPILVNTVLSSEGSEHWFKWLLMPFWIKDFCEGKFFGSKAALSKPSAEPDGLVQGAKGQAEVQAGQQPDAPRP